MLWKKTNKLGPNLYFIHIHLFNKDGLRASSVKATDLGIVDTRVKNSYKSPSLMEIIF